MNYLTLALQDSRIHQVNARAAQHTVVRGLEWELKGAATMVKVKTRKKVKIIMTVTQSYI